MAAEVVIAYDALMSETSEVQADETKLSQPDNGETADEPTQPAVENGESQKDLAEAKKLAAQTVQKYIDATNRGDTKTQGEMETVIQKNPIIAGLVSEQIEILREIPKKVEALKEQLGKNSLPLLNLLGFLSQTREPWHLLNNVVSGRIYADLKIHFRRIRATNNLDELIFYIGKLVDWKTDQVDPAVYRSLKTMDGKRGLYDHIPKERLILNSAGENFIMAKAEAIKLRNELSKQGAINKGDH